MALSCLFYDPTDVGNLISGSSALSKTSLNIRKFMVHVLLNLAWRILSIPLLACEMSAMSVVVWAFSGIAFLGDWNENWPFPVLWPLLSFPNLLAWSHVIPLKTFSLCNYQSKVSRYSKGLAYFKTQVIMKQRHTIDSQKSRRKLKPNRNKYFSGILLLFLWSNGC